MKPLFGGFCDPLRRWRMSMENVFLRCTAPLAHTNRGWFFVMHRTLAHTNGEWFFMMHRTVGAYQRGMVLSMGDVDGWQEVFMQNYSCGDCFEVMAFRYFFYDLSFN